MNKRCPKCNSENIYDVDCIVEFGDDLEVWIKGCEDCKHIGFYEEKFKCLKCKKGYLEFKEFNDFIPVDEGDRAAIYVCDNCLKEFIKTIKVDNGRLK